MHSPTTLIASPLEEEDISRAGVFHDDTASNSPERLPGRKGKQKQRAQDPFNDDDIASLSDGDDGGGESYPPTKDDVTESRRIEEVRYMLSQRLRLLTTQSDRTYDSGNRPSGSGGGLRETHSRPLRRRRWSATLPDEQVNYGRTGVPSTLPMAAGRTTLCATQTTPSHSTTLTAQSSSRTLLSS